jgi:NADH dehydrogenase (ubiquinone) flavoprotein 2
VTDNGQVFHINTRGILPSKGPVSLPEELEKRADHFIKQYPQSRSAVMPLLYIAQEHFGVITQAGVEWVAKKLSMPPVQVWEVATFYTMYYKKPVGKYHIQVCRTLPCALSGARKVSEFLYKKLGLAPGEVTKDGMWSFEEVECLGSCGTAPMCQINDVFFENLTDEKLTKILSRIEKEKPDLRFSTVRDELGAGLEGCPKSEII